MNVTEIKDKDKFINTLYEKIKDVSDRTNIKDYYYNNPYNYANHKLAESIINWMDNYKE